MFSQANTEIKEIEMKEYNRKKMNDHMAYMKNMMVEKKTTDSFTRHNMIIGHWKDSYNNGNNGNFIENKTDSEFNQCIQKIDVISAQCIKKMPWTAVFSSAEKVTTQKKNFFDEVKKYIDENCKNPYVKVLMFYYAASSNASIYSGTGHETKGKTYDRFVEEGNKCNTFIDVPSSTKQASEMVAISCRA